MLSRIVWHLNLPKSFLHRLNVLLQILPEAEMDLGQISCRYNMDKNFLDKIKSIQKIGQELYFPNQRWLVFLLNFYNGSKMIRIGLCSTYKHKIRIFVTLNIGSRGHTD